MVLISHRGNVNGRVLDRENTEQYIDDAIALGYDVEIDVWYQDANYWLGHDNPERVIDLRWLLKRKDNLWIHCKNFRALSSLSDHLTVFYHSQEAYTLISNGLIWAHNIHDVDDKCIIPLLDDKDVEQWKPVHVHGVCSDYVEALND